MKQPHPARLLCWFVTFALALTSFSQAATRVYVSVAGDRKILVYALDERGRLELSSQTATDGEPGATVVHPSGRFLLAAIRSEGRLASFSIDPKDGSLTLIGSVDAGADPAFVATDLTGRWLLSAYYRAGKVSVHRIFPNGEIAAWPTHSVATDQNAHAVAVDASNSVLLVPHTRPNAIFQFRFRAGTGQLHASDPPAVHTGPNTGPRHVAFHPKLPIVYADNEQGSSVTRFTLDATNATLTPRETVATIPADFEQRNSCARMVISRDGSMLFAANRGHDSIAAFRLHPGTGAISASGTYKTEKTPRGFALTGDGRFLVAAGQASGKLAVYAVDAKNEANVLTRRQTIDVGRRPWWVTAFTPNSTSEVQR